MAIAAAPAAAITTAHCITGRQFLRSSQPSTSMLRLPFSNPERIPSLSRALMSKKPCQALAAGALSAAPQTLKSRLAAGGTLYGIFLLSGSPTLAEIAGLAGYDYAVIDIEHGPAGTEAAMSCLRALAASRTPAVIRVPEVSGWWAKKALDMGPDGLMFPNVDTVDVAEFAVSCCRYPPRGVRGAAHPVVRASQYGLDDGYLARCEEDLLVMVQVETVQGIRAVEAIAAVDGVDVVQMGPLDLSASMGYLWDPGNKKVREALKDTERRVLGMKNSNTNGSGPYLGGFVLPHDPPEQLKLRGYHMVSGAVDVAMFRRAAAEDVKRFRDAVSEVGEEGSGDDDGEHDGRTKESGYYSD